MIFSFHYILGLVTSFIGSLVSCSMLLLLLWQAPLRRDVLWAAFYALSMIIWSVAAFFLRIQCITGQSPSLPIGIISWAFHITCFSLFMVLCHHAKLFQYRIVKILVITGLGSLAAAAYIHGSGQATQHAVCSPITQYHFDLLPGGKLMLLALVLFVGANLWITLRYRNKLPRQIWLTGLLYCAGALITPIEVLRATTLPILLSSVSTILLTHYALSTHLFTPLAEATHKAKLQSAARTQFLARMSHELRTPLHNILGYSELVLEDLNEKHTDSAQADLRKVTLSGKHLLTLVDNVIDMAKIAEGKLKLSPEFFDISLLIRELSAFIRPLLATNKNRFHLKGLESIVPAEIFADRKRLYQALTNLLENAARYTLEGDITLSITQENGEIIFQVADTGKGMHKDQCAHIFDELEPADEYVSKRGKASGLGLPISRRLVLLMGGDLSCTSSLGRGTTFTLRIPEQSRNSVPVSKA